MRLVLAAVVLGLVAMLLPRLEPFGPTAELTQAPGVLGRATTIAVHLRDRGSGLRSATVQLVPPGGAPVTVAQQEFPRQSWLGSGVHDLVITPTIDAVAAQLPEGPSELRVLVTDHTWWSAVRSQPRVTHAVSVDVTPPTVAPVSSQHRVRVGGSELVVFRASTDATSVGVRVGARTLPGMRGYFADPELVAALFTIPVDDPTALPELVASDAAGNTTAVRFDVTVQPRKFPEKTLPLSDEFLARKVPELLQANGFGAHSDLVAGYLKVNRDGRAASEERIRTACAVSGALPLWSGPFVRLPNGAPLAGFADRRSYDYKGQIIDHAWHLGYDLASLKLSPVPAANNGTVVFAGAIGIYGNTIIVDHGLGLFSLYGHLSDMSVAKGATVTKGQIIGKTGDTGLAGGDHLHFSVSLSGIHVDPVEWWDGHWIRDHVDLRLGAHPRAAAAAATPTAPAAPATPPS